MISGIYAIRSLESQRCYVGSAQNVRKRWTAHRCLLRAGKHHSPSLQRSWNKHGADRFSWEVLEAIADLSELFQKEQIWIERLNASCPKRGFNVAPVAGTCRGVRHSEETKEKVRRAVTGRRHTPEAIARMRIVQAGKVMSAETREKLRQAGLGKKLSEERSRKLHEGNRGRKLTAEHKAKVSAAQKGRERSAEHRAKLGAAKRGKKQAPEHIRKKVETMRRNREARTGQCAFSF